MKHAKLAIALMVIASLAVPTVHAKKLASTPSPYSNGSQAGGLPATNARVTALEVAVATLQADLAAEIAARQAADARLASALNNETAAREAADTRLANALNGEIAARQAADAALSSQLRTIPTVFVTDGSVNIIKDATVTVASQTVPAGDYVILASVQMVNSQTPGVANARCVMRADGTLLADTSDLQFPILTTEVGSTSNSLGSTMFAPLQGSYSSSSPITILVECTESNDDNGGLDAFVQIAALKAGSVVQ
jgi:hypothetical protein